MAHDANVAATALVHSPLSRQEQVVGLIWAVYPSAINFDRALDALESAGMPPQNRSRVRTTLRSSGLISRGTVPGTLRINPRHKPKLDKLYRPIVGSPLPIAVQDSEAVIPVGTIATTRRYIERLVAQINEGYIAGHYDSVAVMLRRLAESLLIEVYVRVGRQDEIRFNGSFVMLDQLLTIFASDLNINKGRHVVRQLRKLKEVGDTAAHDRNYITKQADIDDIKHEARRCISELGALAGL